MARAVVAIHGIAPLLASRLRWQGADGWAQFLREETARAQRRHLRIAELLDRIDAELHQAGIAAVALKGAALYQAGLYGPGERPMADVDLLVRACDVECASQVLQSLGFQDYQTLWKNSLFTVCDPNGPWCPGEAGEHPIKIELHERICEMLPSRLTDISALVFPAHPNPGVNPYPSRPSLLAHLLLHAAGSIVDRALRLIQLHDIALFAGHMADGDWADMLRIGGCQAPWWAFPPLVLTARYYPSRIPRWVLAEARASCPPILSRISQRQELSSVSLSFPWIQAFPSIAWTRSTAEALEYIAKRIVRDTEATSMRELASRSEPGLSPDERRWLGVSQSSRILRWVISRPVRPLTMRAVRSAFNQS
jgi:hypothetical protein